MSLSDTVFHLVIGGAIGFILGYITRYLQEIKEELDEVDAIVKGQRPHDDAGFVRKPTAANLWVFLTIAIVVWAAFSTGHTNAKLKSTQGDLKSTQVELKDAQAAIERLSTCNQKFIVRINKSLNSRAIYVQERADANVDLQKAQAEFLRIVLVLPPLPDEIRREALQKYFGLVNEFVEASKEAKKSAEIFPYPTDAEVSACYNTADDKTEEKKDAAK